MVLERIIVLVLLLSKVMSAPPGFVCCGVQKTNVDGEVYRVYLNEIFSTENSPKCLILKKWVHKVHSYSMTCFRYNDKKHRVAIYTGNTVIDNVSVMGCDGERHIPESITIVSGENTVHIVQYDLSPGRHITSSEEESCENCKRVNYYWSGGARNHMLEDCLEVNHWSKLTKKGYINGWKEKEVPMYRHVIEFTIESTDECLHKGGWKSSVKNVQLICYNCKENLIAQIIYKGYTLTRTTVGSCGHPLQESFNILSPSADNPNAFGVQIWFRGRSCVKKYFDITKNEGDFQVGRDGDCSKSAKYSNPWRRLIQ